MPLTRFAADAIGVVTICLVAILVILGLLCIVYTFYFRSRIHHRGEIIRLSLISRAFHLKWQQTVCKCYIVSNMGFAEPCLFLTIEFLLRAPLQKVETGIMSQKWNAKTAGRILLYCFPVFVLQLLVILIGPQLDKDKGSGKKLPHYFTSTAAITTTGENEVSICTYPLLSTILLGVFAIILTFYLFWLGRRILKLVINKGLQKRVYTLIFSVSGFLPLRVLFLGLSVLYRPEQFMFVALAFLAFLALVCCVGVCICVLVYRPVADSLALGILQDLEVRRGLNVDYNDTMSFIANQSNLDGVEENVGSSASSDTATKGGSISFRTSEKDGTSTGTFVELSLFSLSRNASPPGSPPPLGWPMRPTTQVLGP
ncbi:putative transmembrane protein [Senna tora]|uniref:Putative transmembrane protein n=1 Tax=Senna tora TaxID=362788 RepID=A0A834SFL8_9FABA|nr:putative transmembrane protein [Senna tora]